MKRYQFGLTNVLRARRAQEDVAKAGLIQAHQAAVRAARAVSETRAHYQAAAAASGAEFQLHRQMWELAAQSVTNAEKAEQEAHREVRKATDKYLESARAVSVIEHLDQARREEHATALQREEASLVDELVTAKHVRDIARTKSIGPLGSQKQEDGDL